MRLIPGSYQWTLVSLCGFGEHSPRVGMNISEVGELALCVAKFQEASQDTKCASTNNYHENGRSTVRLVCLAGQTSKRNCSVKWLLVFVLRVVTGRNLHSHV